MEEQYEKFRHEYKYVISAPELALIKMRINGLLKPDPHANSKGFYNIRSVYFDDYKNSCFYDNENGTDGREKFRIRIYDGKSDAIHLELKRKIRGKCQKLSCPISLEECTALLKGEPLQISAENPPLLNKLLLFIKTQAAKPKIITEYERTAFIYKDGNVRVTFDENMRSSKAVTELFSPSLPTRPIMPKGSRLLEVKWDEFLPDPIYKSVNIPNLRQTAYSKYYLCRKFSL